MRVYVCAYVCVCMCACLYVRVSVCACKKLCRFLRVRVKIRVIFDILLNCDVTQSKLSSLTQHHEGKKKSGQNKRGKKMVKKTRSAGNVFMRHGRCNTLQHAATHCKTLQHTATHSQQETYSWSMANTLQHTATHCNTLQHTVCRKRIYEAWPRLTPHPPWPCR